MALTANFEAGTLGNTVASADPGSANAWDSVVIDANATDKYDNTHAAHGTQAAKMTSVTGSPCRMYMVWSTSLGAPTDSYGRVYLWPNDLGWGAYFVGFTTGTFVGGYSDCGLLLDGSNKVALRDALGTTQATTTHAISTGQWSRIEWHVISSTTAGQIEVKLFLGSNVDGTTPDETLATASTINTNSSCSYLPFGMLNNTAPLTFWMDDIVGGATSYPGPAVSTPVVAGDLLLFNEISGPGAAYGPYAFIEDRFFATAGQTFLQSLTASDVVTTSTLLKQVGKILSATSTTTASFVKQAGKILSATSTTTATLVKQINKILTATTVVSTATLLAQKVILKTLSATVTTTATLLKQVNKILSATVTTTATLIKQVNKTLSATSTTTATLAAIKVILRTLTASTVTTTATMTRQVNKLLTVTVTTTATLLKQVNKTLTATTVVTTATLTRLKQAVKALTANLTTTSTFQFRVNKILAATSSITATLDALSSAILIFLAKPFDKVFGHPHVEDNPGEAEWESGPKGNISSSPHEKDFD